MAGNLVLPALKDEPRVKKGDAWVILAVLLLSAAAVFFWRTDGQASTAVVTWDGQIVARLPLSGARQEYPFGDHAQIRILVENGRARFSASDCPDQLCVHSGWLNAPNRTAACLPNRCLLYIEGDTGADLPDVLIGAVFAGGAP